MILCTFYFSLRLFADLLTAARLPVGTSGPRASAPQVHALPPVSSINLVLPAPGAAAAEAHAASSSHHPFALWSSRHSVVSRLGF